MLKVFKNWKSKKQLKREINDLKALMLKPIERDRFNNYEVPVSRLRVKVLSGESRLDKKEELFHRLIDQIIQSEDYIMDECVFISQTEDIDKYGQVYEAELVIARLNYGKENEK